jgi:hypothetical protein
MKWAELVDSSLAKRFSLFLLSFSFLFSSVLNLNFKFEFILVVRFIARLTA